MNYDFDSDNPHFIEKHNGLRSNWRVLFHALLTSARNQATFELRNEDKITDNES